jgi:hypothetical protein
VPWGNSVYKWIPSRKGENIQIIKIFFDTGSEKILKCRLAENVSFNCTINLRGEILYKISDLPSLLGASWTCPLRPAHVVCVGSVADVPAHVVCVGSVADVPGASGGGRVNFLGDQSFPFLGKNVQ